MPLMRKLMLNVCHFWVHDLIRAKVTGVEPPTTLVVSSLGPSLAVAPDLTGWWPSLGTSHHSAAAGKLTGCGDKSWLWKLNCVDAGGMEWGQPGPLGSICPSVMAWVINCWPSPRLTGLALSWACLPTQMMVPDKVNVASHTSPKLSPSNDCYP